MTEKPNRPASVNLPAMEMPADLAVEYINLVRISHSPMELVFDFAQMLPGGGAKIRSRVVMSPLGSKLFLRALAENLTKYEAANGEINVPGDSSLADYLFRPTPPPEDPKKPNEPPG
jgi:hypothetical protein